jgi:hypothetical protein
MKSTYAINWLLGRAGLELRHLPPAPTALSGLNAFRDIGWLSKQTPVRTVLDVGANIGNTIVDYTNIKLIVMKK